MKNYMQLGPCATEDCPNERIRYQLYCSSCLKSRVESVRFEQPSALSAAVEQFVHNVNEEQDEILLAILAAGVPASQIELVYHPPAMTGNVIEGVFGVKFK